MQQQQPQQKEPFDPVKNFRNGFNSGLGVLAIYQRAIIVPMRHRFGVEALGMVCFYSFLLQVIWGSCLQDPLMWGYTAYWVLCLLMRRSEAKRLVRKGERIHSISGGWPREAMRIPFVRTPGTAMLIVEPIIVFGLGLGCWFVSKHWHTPPGLATFLMIGAPVLCFLECVRQKVHARKAHAILDARLEQEAVMQDFRSKWGNS